MPAQYKLAIKVGICLALLALAFFAGWKWNGSIWNGKVLTMQKAALEAKAKADAENLVRERKAQDLVDQIALLKAQNDKIAKETQSSIQRGIDDYVKKHPTPTCVLDGEWMYLHDAAALHVSPGALPASVFNGASVSSTDVIRLISHNYDLANQCLRDYQSWIDYGSQVRAALNTADKK